jgi:glucose/arabinose dehydrogenase
VESAFPNLRFLELTNLLQPDDGTDRIFVTEHAGCIHVFPNDSQVLDSTIFLDLSEIVRIVDEDGLEGLVFDPAFTTNGHFYVYYAADKHHRTILSRFTVNESNPNLADLESERVILEIPQPAKNHNGGKLAFGPDGFLYITVGEGGLVGEAGVSQDNSNHLGTILRIDVQGLSNPGEYRIPSDNPFVGDDGVREEIWAYGFRNPWGLSFDQENGRLWTTDVGRATWEEIIVVEAGKNYGWPIMEGPDCADVGGQIVTDCDRTGLVPALLDYGHDQGCAAIGGYVYHGSQMPSVEGAYVYADYCTGAVMGVWFDGQNITKQQVLVQSGLAITSIGEDLEGNIYVLDAGGLYHFGGIKDLLSLFTSEIYRLVETK